MEGALAQMHAGNSFGLSTPASVNVIPSILFSFRYLASEGSG